MKGSRIQSRWSKKELLEIQTVCDEDEITPSDLIRRAVYEYLLRRSNAANN